MFSDEMLPEKKVVDRPASARALRRAVILALAGLAISLAVVVASPLLARRAAAALEARLAAETGLIWRVGAARLRMSSPPALVLEKVEVGDAAGPNLGAAAAEATVSADLATLLGAPGAWRATLAGVSARLPIAEADDASPDTTTSAGGARGGSLRAVISGVDVGLDSPHIVTMRAARADIAFGFAPGAKQRVDVEATGKGYLANFAFETTPAATLQNGAPATFSIAPAGGGEASMGGHCLFSVSRKALVCRDLDATVQGAPVTGGAEIRLSPAPEARLDLHLKELTLGRGGDALAIGSVEALDPAAFGALPVTAAVGVDEFRVGALRAGGVNARLALDGAGVDVALEARSFYEGSARGHYTLTTDPDRLHQLSASIKGGRMSSLLTDIAGVAALDGRGDAHLEFQASGASVGEIVATARGSADFALADGRLSGASVSGLLDAPVVSEFLEGNAGSLTSFNRFSGAFTISDGKAISKNLRLESRAVTASGRGSADLQAGTIDFTFTPALGGPRGGLHVPVRVSGPWKDPSVAANLDSVLENPLATMHSLERIGAALFGDEDDSDAPRPKKGGDVGKARHRK